MSEAKRCDACNKLYVPNTDDDLMDRPVIKSTSIARKKRFTGVKLFFRDEPAGYKDLCPACAQKVADVFVDVDVFENDDISDNNEEKENE